MMINLVIEPFRLVFGQLSLQQDRTKKSRAVHISVAKLLAYYLHSEQ